MEVIDVNEELLAATALLERLELATKFVAVAPPPLDKVAIVTNVELRVPVVILDTDDKVDKAEAAVPEPAVELEWEIVELEARLLLKITTELSSAPVAVNKASLLKVLELVTTEVPNIPDELRLAEELNAAWNIGVAVGPDMVFELNTVDELGEPVDE